MTRTKNASIAMVAGMIVMLIVAMTYFVRFDSPGLIGLAVGAGLGLVNMVVSYKLAQRSLKHGLTSAMTVLMGGFFARLVVLVVLILVFQRTAAVNEIAFALSFMILFFANLMLEIAMVSRNLQGNGGTA